MKITKEQVKNYITAGVIFTIGDLISQLINWKVSGTNPSLSRTVGMFLVGTFLYPLEIDAYFRWLANSRWRVNLESSTLGKLLASLFQKEGDALKLTAIGRTIGAALFFNPIWVARHFTFIELFTKLPQGVNLKFIVTYFISSLKPGLISFIYGLPLSLIGNYVVQEKMRLELRVIGSAILTLIFAIYYGVMAWLLK